MALSRGFHIDRSLLDLPVGIRLVWLTCHSRRASVRWAQGRLSHRSECVAICSALFGRGGLRGGGQVTGVASSSSAGVENASLAHQKGFKSSLQVNYSTTTRNGGLPAKFSCALDLCDRIDESPVASNSEHVLWNPVLC